MNRPGVRTYSGELTNVGTTYATLTIDTPEAPPRTGWVARIVGEILAGPAGAIRLRMIGGLTTADVEYDDTDNPGSPITLPFDFADTKVYYDRSTGSFQVDVATDDGLSSSTVRITIDIETV